MIDRDRAAIDDRLEQFRVELIAYCYRMLSSPFEAEDAVQETLLRAWRASERFDERRASLRTWLYAIATNVCLDMLRGAQRRARAMDLAPPTQGSADLGAPLPESTWVHPIPSSRALAVTEDPAELAAQHDTIRLAFVAALQHLPPRQRATLILRDVLCWSADEVARLLGTTVASSNSALQRARATLKTIQLVRTEALQPTNAVQQQLLDRYCAAFERYDVETLVALLHEDATMSMPPFAWWLRGRGQIRQALLGAGRPCEGARLVPIAANGSPAYAQYRAAAPNGDLEAFGITVIELCSGLITETATYLDPSRLFPLFGLPMSFPVPLRITQ